MMRTFHRYIVFALSATVFAQGTAQASPKYLSCVRTQISKGKTIISHDNITVNEDTGKATFSVIETGWSKLDISAAFGPDKITFNTSEPDAVMVDQIAIDRTTLAYEFITIIGDLRDVISGQCHVAQTTKHKV